MNKKWKELKSSKVEQQVEYGRGGEGEAKRKEEKKSNNVEE